MLLSVLQAWTKVSVIHGIKRHYSWPIQVVIGISTNVSPWKENQLKFFEYIEVGNVE